MSSLIIWILFLPAVFGGLVIFVAMLALALVKKAEEAFSD